MYMKFTLIRIIATALSFLDIVTPVTADPLQDGVTAYENGDNATALQFLRPLADGGDAHAQTILG